MAAKLLPIIDQINFRKHKPYYKDSVLAAVAGARFNAERFVFDGEASERVGEFLRDCPDLAINNDEFARPPYETTYIELDSRLLFKGWTGVSYDPAADDRIGLLFIGEYQFMVVDSVITAESKIGKAGVGFLSVRHNRPQAGGPLTPTQRRIWAMGNRRQATTTGADGNTIVSQNACHVTYPVSQQWLDSYDMQPTVTKHPERGVGVDWTDYAFKGGGDLIIGLVCLLLINQPSKDVYIREVTRSRQTIGGKSQVHQRHHVVNIKLTKEAHVRTLYAGHRASPARHSVMGHWAHYHREPCPPGHAWAPIDLSGNRYECPHCGTKRVWRRDHLRGDATKGWVTKQYEVHK